MSFLTCLSLVCRPFQFFRQFILCQKIFAFVTLREAHCIVFVCKFPCASQLHHFILHIVLLLYWNRSAVFFFVCKFYQCDYLKLKLKTLFFLFQMWLAALALVLVVCILLYLDTIKPKKFPPGPKWVPILGSAAEVYKLREKTGYLYKAVKELSRTYCKDGAALGLKIGKDRIVMVNSLEANKEMLCNEDLDGRPKGIFYQTRTWGERRGVLLTDGELWKEQRRFLVKHLKEFGFGRKGMGNIACSEAAHMINDVLITLGDKGQGVIQMHNFFNTYILNTLWSMMAGIRYNPKEPQMQVLQDLLFDLFSAIDMVGTAFSHFPILSIIAPTMSGYRDFVKTHKRIWKFLREEIGRHEERFDPEKEDRDFMDVYVRILREHGEVNTYSKGQLVAMCMDMFMAGTETTSKSMSFGFSYLVREQEVQKKAQEEIDRVVGRDRMPCLDDRDQ